MGSTLSTVALGSRVLRKVFSSREPDFFGVFARCVAQEQGWPSEQAQLSGAGIDPFGLRQRADREPTSLEICRPDSILFFVFVACVAID